LFFEKTLIKNLKKYGINLFDIQFIMNDIISIIYELDTLIHNKITVDKSHFSHNLYDSFSLDKLILKSYWISLHKEKNKKIPLKEIEKYYFETNEEPVN
jgi:hypothetical protein